MRFGAGRIVETVGSCTAVWAVFWVSQPVLGADLYSVKKSVKPEPVTGMAGEDAHGALGTAGAMPP